MRVRGSVVAGMRCRTPSRNILLVERLAYICHSALLAVYYSSENNKAGEIENTAPGKGKGLWLRASSPAPRASQRGRVTLCVIQHLVGGAGGRRGMGGGGGR